MEQSMGQSLGMFGDFGNEKHFPELKLDHRLFNDLSIVLPEDSVLQVHDPELARLLREYRNGHSQAKTRLSAHIDTSWRSNITLVDFAWEKDKAESGEREPPELGFTPFDVVQALLEPWTDMPVPPPQDDDTILSRAEFFFAMTLNAVTLLRDRMMVEVTLGEMADVLERIHHQALDHRCARGVKDGSAPIEWPDKYSVIHMSNIPDYVGGPLTSFLYGSPILERGQGTGLVSCVLRNPPRWKSIAQFLSEYLLMYDPALVRSHFNLKLSSDTPSDLKWKGGSMGFPLMPYFLWERTIPREMTFEQLMPKQKLLHWLHAHFLKLCLPYPRAKKDYTLVYAPLNMTVFMRLIVHVAQLGYPAHWLSTLITSILQGEITTTARAPRRVVLLRKDVDEVHAPRKLCMQPWSLELSVLVSLWQGVLPFGLIAPARLVPRTQDIAEYTVAFSRFQSDQPHVPHFILVFYDEKTFGKPPQELRSLLLDDEKVADSTMAQAKRKNGVRVLTTFRWAAKDRSATFWMDEGAFDKMVQDNWRMYVWRTDTWEKESNALELQSASVQKKAWQDWAFVGSAA